MGTGRRSRHSAQALKARVQFREAVISGSSNRAAPWAFLRKAATKRLERNNVVGCGGPLLCRVWPFDEDVVARSVNRHVAVESRCGRERGPTVGPRLPPTAEPTRSPKISRD